MSLVEQIRKNAYTAEAAKIRWAMNMQVEPGMEIGDYGHIAMPYLTARFAKWPEDGQMTLSQPKTWWDHLKKHLRSRYPRLCGYLKFQTIETTYFAAAILPAITLPPGMEQGMFPVFWGSPKTEEVQQ